MASLIDTTGKSGNKAADVPPVFEDNAQLVDDAYTRLKAGFKTGKTKKYSYRVTQLN